MDFAASLLGDLGEQLRDEESLRDTVLHARDLWLTLYRVAQMGEEPAS